LPVLVNQFFNTLSVDYDARILQAVPPYQAMLSALLASVFLTDTPTTPLQIVELGCGTGNLSQALSQRFPTASLTLVDLSGDMLALAQSKLASHQGVLTCHQADFNQLVLPNNHYDLVISSLAIHHLQDADKQTLYGTIGQWLKPNGGQFRCADQCLALPAQAHQQNITRWKQWIAEEGASPEDAQLWHHHTETMDHYASLSDHFTWMAQAGLQGMDCYWRLLFWTVFGADRT
jgi:tRNA (cmo5U34)-methyltransferase